MRLISQDPPPTGRYPLTPQMTQEVDFLIRGTFSIDWLKKEQFFFGFGPSAHPSPNLDMTEF